MSRRARLALFALAGRGPARRCSLIGLHGLPAFGDYHGIYGLLRRPDRAAPRATPPTSSPR